MEGAKGVESVVTRYVARILRRTAPAETGKHAAPSSLLLRVLPDGAGLEGVLLPAGGKHSTPLEGEVVDGAAAAASTLGAAGSQQQQRRQQPKSAVIDL